MADVDGFDSDDDRWPEEWTRRERELVERVESELGPHRDDLERRHWIQAFAAAGLLGAGSRELYRREVLRALPDVKYRPGSDPGAWEASWRPDPTSVPEGLTSTAGFSALMAFASIGSRRRASDQPWLSLLTAGLSLMQTAGSTRKLVESLRRGDVDALATLETVVSASTVPLAIPEAVRAVRELLDL